MIRMRVITVVATVAVAAAAFAATPPDDLLSQAKAARQEAEKELADARNLHLQERKAVATNLQAAYEALAAAKADADAARQALRHLEATSVDLERTAATLRGRIQSVIRQAAEAAGVTVDPSDPIEAMENVLWERFELRLADIRRGRRVVAERETVVARSGDPVAVPVLRLGWFASYACGDAPETCGLLRPMPDGRWLIAGPLLGQQHAAALRAAVAGRPARVPLDIDGSLADRAPSAPWTVWAWYEAGGWVMYPIVAVGVLGLFLVMERVGYLAATQTPPSLVERVLACLQRRDALGAREALARSRGPTARVLLASIEAVGGNRDQREAAMETALLAEAPKLERSLSLLAALAGVAPLLGLLGTVSGMIATFDTISAAGTGNPRLLSGGLSEALITTQLGLMVAIPLLLVHAWLRRWVERREVMLEHQAVQAFGLDEQDEGTSV
jgi:biopolymer transport protein ExbB